MRKQVSGERRRASAAKRALKSLAAVLSLTVAAYLLLENSYFVRELLLFLGLMALVVLAGAVLVAVGLLFHWAGQNLVRLVRGVESRMAWFRHVAAERHAGAFVGGLHDEDSAMWHHLG